MDRADELKRFKSDVNFVEFAASQGYEVVRAESSKASTVMVDEAGDKIVVATDADGHGIYFSVRDDADNGSIIDFIQRRTGTNLGQVRKELRCWCPSSSTYRLTPEAKRQAKPERSSKDRQQVLAVWMKMNPQPATGHLYLRQVRQLSLKTLQDKRFSSHIRIDGRGNAVFPHYDKQGLCGYELKNKEFTGFAKSGEKGVWLSTNISHAPRVVFVESAIDALSHAQLGGDVEAESAYVSFGGAMSEKQRQLVELLLSKANSRGAAIVLATDADEAGRKMADLLRSLAPAGALVERQEPEHGKDWNNVVIHRDELENGHEFGV